MVRRFTRMTVWLGMAVDDTDRDFYVYGCALYDGDLKPGYAGCAS